MKKFLFSSLLLLSSAVYSSDSGSNRSYSPAPAAGSSDDVPDTRTARCEDEEQCGCLSNLASGAKDHYIISGVVLSAVVIGYAIYRRIKASRKVTSN